MIGFPGDSVPLVGSFLRPRFLLLRALSVFLVQPHHTYAKNLACLTTKQGPSVARPYLLWSRDPKYGQALSEKKSSPLENSVPSYNKCWLLRCALSMALCFIPLFDKNKTPLPILKQRKKRVTLLSQKYKTVFFSWNKRERKKRLEEGNHPGQCQSQLLFSPDTSTEDKEIVHIETSRREWIFLLRRSRTIPGPFPSLPIWVWEEQILPQPAMQSKTSRRKAFRRLQESPARASPSAHHHQLTRLLFTEPANAQHLITPGSLSESNTSEKEAGGLYLSTHQNRKYLIGFSQGHTGLGSEEPPVWEGSLIIREEHPYPEQTFF